MTCPNGGGDLVEADEPANALWASGALINPRSLTPGTPSRPGASGVGHLTGPLGEQMRAVLLEGTPFLVSAPLVTGRDDALGVVMHVTDAQHLAARVPLRIERNEPDPGTIRLQIVEVGAKGEGPNVGLALAALAASARRQSEALLSDPLTPSGVRDTALRLWLADAAHQLPALLTDCLDA